MHDSIKTSSSKLSSLGNSVTLSEPKELFYFICYNVTYLTTVTVIYRH